MTAPARKRVVVCYAFGANMIQLGEHIACAFEHLGHQVLRHDSTADERFGTVIRLAKSAAKLLGLKDRLGRLVQERRAAGIDRRFVSAVTAFAPDLLLVIRGERISPQAVMSACPPAKKIIWWVKHSRWQEALAEERHSYDAAFSIDAGLAHLGVQHLPSWAMENGRAPAAADDFSSRDIPLLFVGAWTARRQHYLEALADLPLFIVGPKWDSRLPAHSALRQALRGKWANPEALSHLYRRARVTIDINQIDQGPQQGANMRLAEVPLAGSVLLTEDGADVRIHYRPGEEVRVFQGVASLRDEVLALLDDPDQCARIAAAGRLRAAGLPTYEDRAKALLGSVGLA